MSLRIRQDGTIWCAAMHPEQPGDIYVDDGRHYWLTVELHVIVTDHHHLEHGQWWWAHDVPAGVSVDEWWA